MEKLKPCPFCGGDAYTTITEEGHFWVAGCRDCHAQIMLCNKEWQAIKMWNRRYLNWEKTSERLPTLHEDVLLVDDDYFYEVGYLAYIGRNSHVWVADRSDTIYGAEDFPYWMPLPDLSEVEK